MADMLERRLAPYQVTAIQAQADRTLGLPRVERAAEAAQRLANRLCLSARRA